MQRRRQTNSVCNAENLTQHFHIGLSQRLFPICLFLLTICFSTSLSVLLYLSSPPSLLSRFQFENLFDLIWYCFFYYYYIWIRNTETVLHNQIHNAHFRMIAFLVCELQKSRFEPFKSKYFSNTKKWKRKWNDKIYCHRIDLVYTLYSVQ